MVANGSGSGPANGRAAALSTAGADRLPPQNLEAERGVLGSILLDNDVLHDVVPLLKVEDFYRDTHQIIYRAIRDLYDLGKAVDAITLADELTRRGEFEKIGGDEALAQILDRVPHAANAKYYAQIVRQKSVSRELIEAANEILRDGYSNTFTAGRAPRAGRATGLHDRRGPDQRRHGRDPRGGRARRWTGSSPCVRGAAPGHGRRAPASIELDDMTGRLPARRSSSSWRPGRAWARRPSR